MGMHDAHDWSIGTCVSDILSHDIRRMLLEKEQANEGERQRTGGEMQEGREKEEGRERERNVSGTPDSKYPPDTLHLSLHVPSLGYLTTDASSCDRTEGRKRERSNDRSLGMPVVPIEKLLIRDSEEGGRARNPSSGGGERVNELDKARDTKSAPLFPIFKRGDPLVTKYPLILFEHVQRPRFGKSPYKSQPCLSAL